MVEDPYRWLEDIDSAETLAWIKAQNSLSFPFLAAIPSRDRIREKLTTLLDYERYRTPTAKAGRIFYRHNTGLQDQDVLYVIDAAATEPRVLIDPNAFSDDRTASLGEYESSPDGRLVAYSISISGSDWREWRIRDVETGEDLEDRLTGIKFTTPSWARDASGFFYSRYPLDETGQADDQRQVSVYFHLLGAAQDEDRHVYSITDHPTRNPEAILTDDGRYLVLIVTDGYESNGVYFQDLDRDDSSTVHLLDDWDALYNFLGNEGSRFFFSTSLEAPNYRVVAIDVDRAERQNWHEVIPEAAMAIESCSMVGSRLIVQYLKDARSHVEVFDLDGRKVDEIQLPGIGSTTGFLGTAHDTQTFYSFSSFTVPNQIFRYDIATNRSTLFGESSVDVDLSRYRAEQVFYESRDGTRVPMFLIHERDLSLDGNNATLLYGYGGFNVALTPTFSSSRLTWLEMGGVLAIANLRGGGEYGEAWHSAGTKERKQNVFDDFIAAAEWLIDQGYTSSRRLAIQGGSNGGLLVGAVMTQRPELFAAALPEVGVLDMLRYHTASANARQWSTDFGLSESEDEFVALYAYSPYHNTRPGACYPPTLVTTADHDDRVEPWHSFKFTAALQRDQGCGNPVLIRVETRAGHGAGKPIWMQIEETADEWAFLAWALDLEVPDSL